MHYRAGVRVNLLQGIWCDLAPESVVKLQIQLAAYAHTSHAHMPVYTRSHMPCTYAHMCPHTHTHIHTHTCPQMHTHTHACTHSHTSMHTITHVHARTPHTHALTHTHTHTHTHARTSAPRICSHCILSRTIEGYGGMPRWRAQKTTPE